MSANAAVVRDQFTMQARAFAGAAHATDAVLMAQYVRLIGPAPGERILDVAAGPGLVAAALAPSGCRVTILDLTPRMLSEAGRVAPSASRVEADASQLPIRESCFDAVICRLALHHLPDPAVVIAGMVRAARPGGRVLINDIVTGEDAGGSAVTEEIERLRDPSHSRCLTAAELVARVLAAGLRIEVIEPWVMTVDHDEWMNRVYPPEHHRVLVAERLWSLVGRDLGGMRVEERDGVLWISRRGLIVRAHRPARPATRSVPLTCVHSAT